MDASGQHRAMPPGPPAMPPGPPGGPHPRLPGDPAVTPPAGASPEGPAGPSPEAPRPEGTFPEDVLPEDFPEDVLPEDAYTYDGLPGGGRDSSGGDLGLGGEPGWLGDPVVAAWLDATADDPQDAVVLSTGAAFALGGAADSMLPGPVLADLSGRVHGDGLSGLDDDALTGVLQAASRLASWAAALRLAAVSQLASCREARARASGDWRPFEHASDEIAFALTLTGRSAGRLLALAMALDRLPATRAALEAGQIDERRAEIIADELAGLDDEQAVAVEAALIGKAAGLTSGQLRPAVRRAVLAVNPGAAKQRKDEALKDARVEAFTETAGTAALCGRDLPPAEVLAADTNLTALAQDMRQAGIEGSLDELRACAYLHLLTGHDPDTLLAAVAARRDGEQGASAGTPGDGADGPGQAGEGTPAGTPAAGPAGPGPRLRGTVNLTLPLATWLGWSRSPGDAAGFGPLDAEDSRTVAAWLARHPATQWCLTLTGPAGHALAHGCARTSPGPGGPRPGGLGSGGPRPGRAGRENSPPSATGPPGAWDWLTGISLTPLQTRDCTHPRQSRAYQPPASLRHLIQIRNATCTAPGCRRPAVACDLDHTVPHHRGGLTCECNIGPACRRHHRTKQAPHWTLTHHQPGTLTWTTPAGRSYTTTPTTYPS